MRLEKIGFYTLSDKRAKTTTITSPIQRGELILTDRCNLRCPYCRGLKKELRGDLPFSYAKEILEAWLKEGLNNVRFSGGEPTLYSYLPELVQKCMQSKVKRIAISTNGTSDLEYYKKLVTYGVNDFSISLDSGCCVMGEQMTGGIKNSWRKASESIKYLSKHVYTTVGVVFNELNVKETLKTIEYIDTLCPSDIRIIPSAQYNKAIPLIVKIKDKIKNKYPILYYRIRNFLNNKNFRGIKENDCPKCYLVLDDVAVAGKYQFPCIIYLREQGIPISKMNKNFRSKRLKWFKNHNSYKDEICQKNCLDVCIDYNNKVDYYINKLKRNIC